MPLLPLTALRPFPHQDAQCRVRAVLSPHARDRCPVRCTFIHHALHLGNVTPWTGCSHAAGGFQSGNLTDPRDWSNPKQTPAQGLQRKERAAHQPAHRMVQWPCTRRGGLWWQGDRERPQPNARTTSPQRQPHWPAMPVHTLPRLLDRTALTGTRVGQETLPPNPGPEARPLGKRRT